MSMRITSQSTLLLRGEGYIGNVTVLSDAENPDKPFVVYRAMWANGEEASDTFTAVCKGAMDDFDAPQH